MAPLRRARLTRRARSSDERVAGGADRAARRKARRLDSRFHRIAVEISASLAALSDQVATEDLDPRRMKWAKVWLAGASPAPRSVMFFVLRASRSGCLLALGSRPLDGDGRRKRSPPVSGHWAKMKRRLYGLSPSGV
jgi:hypothetical protein